MQKHIEKIKNMFEALPYIKKFYGKTVVIKYGGSAMLEGALKESFAHDIVLMKYIGINPVIVHGGGPQIGEHLEKIGKESKFVQGIRVTDSETMEVVEEVLVEKVNKEISNTLNAAGAKVMSIGGKGAGLIKAKSLKVEGEDMGHAGEVDVINEDIIHAIEDKMTIPVIAPVGHCEEGKSYNINADTVAGSIAAALGAEKLILLTDVEGVLDKDKKLITTLTAEEAEGLIKDGSAVGGMVPKLRCCINSIFGGVGAAHIIDGRVEHAVLLEIFTDSGIGTIIKASGESPVTV